MVQTLETGDSFPVPFPYIVLAHNQRYPSPYGKHILSSDVFSREFDPSTGCLRTTRLVLKRGKVPRWAPTVIQRIDTTWVLEQTELHLGSDSTLAHLDHDQHPHGGAPTPSSPPLSPRPTPTRELRTRSRNLDRTEFMEVCETQVFRPNPHDPLRTTEVVTRSRVTSEFGFWPLSHRIEAYGVSKLPRSIEGARLGLLLVAELLLHPSTCSTLLSSGPLRPYAFDPVPSPLTLAVRQKLVEARTAWQADPSNGGAGGPPQQNEQDLDELSSAGGGEPRGLRAWRVRWRTAVARGQQRFRRRVCAVTGFWCDEPEPVGAAVGAGESRSGSGSSPPPPMSSAPSR